MGYLFNKMACQAPPSFNYKSKKESYSVFLSIRNAGKNKILRTPAVCVIDFSSYLRHFGIPFPSLRQTKL